MLILILAVVTVSVTVGAVLWWLLVETEGVYLGRRVVIGLYDLYARRYDRIKHFQPQYEQWLLAEPLLAEVAPRPDPLVLDAATGTGRLPLALCEHPMFTGRVVGVDLSRGMLAQAARKLTPFADRVDLVWSSADDLPFADDTFDIVTCLEALEFMPDAAHTLRELVRVLRPGGVLLITNRINTRWMPGKTWTEAALIDHLEACGIDEIAAELWQVDYSKVWAWKRGDSDFVGARPLAEILRCPGTPMKLHNDVWHCENSPTTTRAASAIETPTSRGL